MGVVTGFEVSEKVWEVFKKKQVSHAVVFDITGNILWHRGKEIETKSIYEINELPGDTLRQAMVRGKIKNKIKKEPPDVSLPLLFMDSLLISQISDDYFLYIRGHGARSFECADCEIFMILGEMLGAKIHHSHTTRTNAAGISGSSGAIEHLKKTVLTYSTVEEPLLITGETGTGKNHTAEYIHNISGKKGKFVVINTPGIPENLIESELFGHKKGSFTNALYDRSGLVEEACGGTLLVDEITEVSPAFQAKLLRFIDSGKYNRLGESRERTSNARIIATTNRDLKKAIEKKELREDLYYRLSVLEIEIPPLRNRRNDLRDLVLENIKYLNNKQIGEGFWDALYYYDWPGNVRELLSVLKRIGLQEKETITGKDLELVLKGSFRNRTSCGAAGMGCAQIWEEIKRGGCFWDVVKGPYMCRELKRAEVRDVIQRGLELAKGRYNELMEIFNMKQSDYHRFMRFLHDQDLIPKKQKKVTK